MSQPNQPNQANQQTWHGYPTFGWRPADPLTPPARWAATGAAAGATTQPARYDVVRVRYRDAACGGETRELVLDRAWQATAARREPTTYAADLTTEAPVPFGDALALVERLIAPLGTYGAPDDGEERPA